MKKFIKLKNSSKKLITVYGKGSYNAAYVKRLFAVKGVLQSHLIDLFEVSQPVISRKIQGSTKWEPYELLTISKMIGCSVEDIINPSDEQINSVLQQSIQEIGG